MFYKKVLVLLLFAVGIDPNGCSYYAPNYQKSNSISSRSTCPRGSCQYYAKCQNRVWQFCGLESGFTGICCEDGQRDKERVTRVPATQSLQQTKPPVTHSLPQTVEFESQPVERFIESLHQLEDELVGNEILPGQNSEDSLHQNFFGTSSQALREAAAAEQVLQAFINFAKSEHLTAGDIRRGRWNVRNTSLASVCPPNPSCENKILYRQPDGTCNNLLNTNQGRAISSFARLLPPDYADGVSAPRMAADGSALPNPRLVSLRVALDVPIETNHYSLLLMQYGQFIDHDLSRTGLTRTHNGSQISCCDQRVLSNPRLRHPACFEIAVPEQDLFLRGENQRCINFVRSSPSISPKCRFGVREQLNQVSSYFDGSQIYGSSNSEEVRLRSFQNGQLKIEQVNNEDYLPYNQNSTTCRIPKELNRKCFLSGDIRANEVPDLTVLHIVWHREHNRVAEMLSRFNPGWPDEIVYQETKRVIVAQFQHIIYNEFLPLVLGIKTIEHFGLTVAESYNASSYNPVVDATILNEFATAAYRLHSLVQGVLHFMSPDGRRNLGQTTLRKYFGNPEMLYEQGIMEMRLGGLTAQAIGSFDNYFSEELTNHLFQKPGKRFGLDLVALNIQRGRDHGLPGYTKYRQLCGLSRVDSFADLVGVFSDPDTVHKLEQLYNNVEDIDLFIGGTSERPLAGAVVGPTFACILGEQFRRLKQGDRFWYENDDPRTAFSTQQIAELKKVTMARVLCDNSRLGLMQPNAFLMPGEHNPKVACDSLPRMNLIHWMQH